MVKVTESEFNEQKFYHEQGKEFVERIKRLSDDELVGLGRMVHDLPKRIATFRRDNLIANHRDHEVFKKLVVDVHFIMRQMGAKNNDV